MDLVFDVAVFDTRSGQSRALDRYARAHPAAPGSDEALTLDALQHSRFHIVRVLRRHQIAGLVTEDTVSHEQLWLMDEGFEATARSGMGLATRLLRVNGFYMTTGAAIPVTADVLKEAIASRSAWQNETPSRFVNDPRFPEHGQEVRLTKICLDRAVVIQGALRGERARAWTIRPIRWQTRRCLGRGWPCFWSIFPASMTSASPGG